MLISHQTRKGHMRIVRGLLVLLIAAGGLVPGIQPVRAQDDGDDQDTGIIFGYNTPEILFPAALRFLVQVNAPSDKLASILLSIEPEESLPRQFALDLKGDLYNSTDTISEFIFTWRLSDEPTPVPFEDVSFTWRVETLEGEVSTATGEFRFVDVRRGRWQTAGEDTPLILHWHNAALGGETLQADILRLVYGLLQRQTGLRPTFEFAIYDRDVELCETVELPDSDQTATALISRYPAAPDDGGDDAGDQDDAAERLVWFPCSGTAYEQRYAEAGIIFLQRTSPHYPDLGNQVIRAMVRDTYRMLWQDIPVPDWFVNGLASFYLPRPGSMVDIKPYARSNTLQGIAGLSQAPSPDSEIYDRWVAEAYLLVLYLADRYGGDAPFELARDAVGYGSFDAALLALTGGDQAMLWQTWRDDWLFSQAATDAVGWTPYSTTTPVPSPTATISPTALPPSPLPTFTPSITPTTTFEADQPATVAILPTRTPTLVRTTTMTPLPPGELPTLTPATPVSSPADDTDNLLLLAIVGAFMVFILSGLVVWWMRRR